MKRDDDTTMSEMLTILSKAYDMASNLPGGYSLGRNVKGELRKQLRELVKLTVEEM